MKKYVTIPSPWREGARLLALAQEMEGQARALALLQDASGASERLALASLFATRAAKELSDAAGSITSDITIEREDTP